MTRMHKDVGEDLPRGKHSSWSGHITSKHSPEHTDSSKVDGAGMHVREQHAPGLAELAGLERALLHETVHRDMEHEACPEKIGSWDETWSGNWLHSAVKTPSKPHDPAILCLVP